MAEKQPAAPIDIIVASKIPKPTCAKINTRDKLTAKLKSVMRKLVTKTLGGGSVMSRMYS